MRAFRDIFLTFLSFLVLLSSTYADTIKPSSPPALPDYEIEAARFLDQLKKGQAASELLQQTAFNPHSLSQVKESLTGEFERFSRHLRRLDSSATILGSAICPGYDDWAVVHFLFQGRVDIRDNDVFFICLKKQANGQWKVGPSLSRFSHVQKDFNPKKRSSLKAFELAATQKNRQLANQIQANALDQFQDAMERAVPPSILAKLTPEKVFRGFLEACRNEDYPAALAYLGAHEKVLPDNFPAITAALKAGLTQRDQRQQWHLLTSRRHAWVFLGRDVEQDSGNLCLRCFSPFIKKQARDILSFRSRHDLSTYNIEVFRERDYWRIFLPNNFLYADAPPETFFRNVIDEEHHASKALNAQIGKKIQTQFPVIYSKDAKALEREITYALENHDFEHFIRLVDHPTELNKAEKQTLYFSLRDFWKKVALPDKNSAIIGSESHEEMSILCLHSPHQLSSSTLNLILIQTQKGWAIYPGIETPQQYLSNYPAHKEALRKSPENYQKLQQKLVAEGALFKGFQLEHWNPHQEPLTKKNKAKLLKSLETSLPHFFELLKTGQLQKATNHSLSLRPIKEDLRNLSTTSYFQALEQVRKSLQENIKATEFIQLKQKDSLTAAGFNLMNQQDQLPAPAILLIQTSLDGQVEFLPETLLYAETNRKAELLNYYTWKTLKSELSTETLESYRSLHQEFTAQMNNKSAE